MQITLDFTEGVNSPDSMRYIVLYHKEKSFMFAGYYDEVRDRYFSLEHDTYFKPEQVMWAEQPNNINNDKKI